LEKLQDRLSSPDIHLVSLRDSWTGTLVPSKFFGSLAIGRPVLYAGSEKSSVARWIDEYEIGWNLRNDTINQVAENLTRLSSQSANLYDLNKHCFEVYKKYFSKEKVINIFHENIKNLC